MSEPPSLHHQEALKTALATGQEFQRQLTAFREKCIQSSLPASWQSILPLADAVVDSYRGGLGAFVHDSLSGVSSAVRTLFDCLLITKSVAQNAHLVESFFRFQEFSALKLIVQADLGVYSEAEVARSHCRLKDHYSDWIEVDPQGRFKYRTHWNHSTTAEQARLLGLEPEYRNFYRHLCTEAHAASLADLPFFQGENRVLHFLSKFSLCAHFAFLCSFYLDEALNLDSELGDLGALADKLSILKEQIESQTQTFANLDESIPLSKPCPDQRVLPK